MKKGLVCCICLMLVCLLVTAACAEAGTLPTINSLLQSNAGKKAEVRDNLDMYGLFNDNFEDINYDFKLIVLQREAPQKEFTARLTYPPFVSDNGFEEDFTGVDIGNSRLWLRGDMMAKLPQRYRASSLENATYLIIAEDHYIWDGTISVSDYDNSSDGDLPEFADTEEMIQYFLEHPRTVKSITYYPKFGVYSLIMLYEAKTKKSSVIDYTYTSSMRFARNPEASQQWDNMTYISALLDSLDEEAGVDIQAAENIIGTVEFAPQEKKDLWSSCINAKEYSTARHSVEEYYWAMAAELEGLDDSQENKEYYDLIIRDRNRTALELFVSFCDYSGFDRSVDSIESSGDYIAAPDYDWMETHLQETVALFN